MSLIVYVISGLDSTTSNILVSFAGVSSTISPFIRVFKYTFTYIELLPDGRAFINACFSAVVKGKVYEVPVCGTLRYLAYCTLPLVSDIQTWTSAAVPAGFLYVIVGFVSSVKLVASNKLASLGIGSNVIDTLAVQFPLSAVLLEGP